MQRWFAQSTKDKAAKKEARAKSTYKNSKDNKDVDEWLGKQGLIDRFGLAKAMARIESGKMITRPDPIIGLDDEWSREYFITTDTVERNESRTDEQELQHMVTAWRCCRR